MPFKPLVRVIGIDDGAFKPKKSSSTILIGVVSRLDLRFEGIVAARIKVDALDAAATIHEMISSSRFEKQVRFILLHGINFAGFNIVDVEGLYRLSGKPVIICFKKKPSIAGIKKALKNLPHPEERIALIESAPKIFRGKGFYFQFHGCSRREAEEVIKKTLLHSSLPEPLRMAHIIASGVTVRGAGFSE